MQSRRAHLRGLLGMAAVAGMRVSPAPRTGRFRRKASATGSSMFPTATSAGGLTASDHAGPQAPLCRSHVQRWRNRPGRQRSAQPQAGKLLDGRPIHAHASSAIVWMICCSSPTAPTSSPCSPIRPARLFRETLSDSITKRKPFRCGLSIHDISKPGEMKEIAFLEMPGLGVDRCPGGRALCLCVGAFRRFHRSLPVHRRPQQGDKTGHRLEMVAAGHEPCGRRSAQRPEGQALRAASHAGGRPAWLRRLARRRVHHPRHLRRRTTQSCCRTSTGRRPSPAARTRRCRSGAQARGGGR